LIAGGVWFLFQLGFEAWHMTARAGEALWLCPAAWAFLFQGLWICTSTVLKWRGDPVASLILKLLADAKRYEPDPNKQGSTPI